MSDLEDIDHEPEDLHLEEELSAPADSPATESFAPLRSASAVPLKIAAVLVVFIGGGAYFMMSRHTALPVQSAASSMSPLPEQAAPQPSPPPGLTAAAPNAAPPAPPPPQNASGTDSTAWNGAAAPSSMPAPAAIPAPAAVPAPLAPLPPGQATPFPPLPAATPPIVNDLPPPATQLANAHDATPAAVPGTPSLVPSTPSSLSAAPSQTSPLAVPELPPPASTEKPAIAAGTNTAPVPPQPAVNGVEAKSGEAMPSAAVPAVDKTEIDKPSSDNGAQTAQVELLEKKIADLEKTISQLQQAAVVAEKPAEEVSPATTPQKPHNKKVSEYKGAHHHKSRHAIATTWVLKAAKPGVAWVAKKGSGDLQMVEAGDSLTGIGKVTAVVKDSSGNWVVNGTKGRISQ